MTINELSHFKLRAGFVKLLIMKLTTSTLLLILAILSSHILSAQTALPEGYQYMRVANENGSYTSDTAIDVAYGFKDKYFFKENVTGTIVFNNETFGDPYPGKPKFGLVKMGLKPKPKNTNTTGTSDLKANFLEWGITKVTGGGGKKIGSHFAHDYITLIDYEAREQRSDGRYPLTVVPYDKAYYLQYSNPIIPMDNLYANFLIFKPCKNVFRHTATVGNTDKSVTTIDNPYLNGNKDLIVLATKYGSDHKKVRSHAIVYNESIKKWQIYSLSGKKIPPSIMFSIMAFEPNSTLDLDNSKFTVTATSVDIPAGGDLSMDIFKEDDSRFITTITTNELSETKLNFQLIKRVKRSGYRLCGTNSVGQVQSIPSGFKMSVLRITPKSETAKELEAKSTEALNKDLAEKAIRDKESEERITAAITNTQEKIKADTEAAKKREEEAAERKRLAEEKKRQAEAEKNASAKADQDALKYYAPKLQPVHGTKIAKPCSGASQTIEFYWDPIDQAESYLVTCSMMVKENNKWVKKNLFEKTLSSNTYKYQMQHSADIERAGALRYYVQAISKGAKYPAQPWEREISLGNCLAVPEITAPVPYSNASLENKWDGASLWNFSWRSIKDCYSYEIEIYCEKRGKRISILEPTAVSQNREQNYLGDALKFAYKTKEGEHFKDEHVKLPARFDKWYVRVRATREDLKGAWSSPVQFQINPAKKPKPEGPAAGMVPISNLDIEPEMETVTIRHRAMCLAQYVVSYDVFVPSTSGGKGSWRREEKLIKFEPASNKSVLPNHVVEIPATAINVEIVMHRVKAISGELGDKFHHIRLPRATATMHYDVYPSVDVGGLPEVVRSEPPVFPQLVKKGDQKIKDCASMIGEVFLSVMNNIYNPARQAELIKEIENEELMGEAIKKYFEAAVAREIKEASQKAGLNFKSVSLSACAGTSMIIGGNMELGVAFPIGDAIQGSLNEDLKNIVFYASPSWSTGFSMGVEGGISLSLWTNEPRDLGGDSKGVVFSFPLGAGEGTYDFTDKAGKPRSLDTGVTITTWFDNDQNFLGFSLNATVGKSISLGKQFVRAYTLIPAEGQK